MKTARAAGWPASVDHIARLGVRLLLTIFVIAGAAVSGAEASTAYAIAPSGTELVRFDTDNPAVVTSLGTVSGLQAGDQLIDLDVRPSNGVLYALGVDIAFSTARIYRIVPPIVAGAIADSGPIASILAGSQMVPFTGLVGAMDFDPVNDRIRVVSFSGQSFTITPSEPASAVPSPAVSGANIVGLASTNNFNSPTAATLFAIDSGSGGRLVRIGGANATDGGASGGPVTSIAAISGATVDNISGFDITANTGEAFALLPGTSGQSGLYSLNLTTGAATSLGNVGSTFGRLKGLAVYTRASLIYGVNTLNQLVIFLSAVPNDLRQASGAAGGTAQAITGITGNVVGLDTRPSTGELFAVTDANQIYKIDPVTAAATSVHALTGGTLSPGDFGMYFEPGSPEKIRLISSAGQNLEIDPDSGAVTALGAVSSNITAISSAPVALYGIDSAADLFVSIQPTVPQVFPEFPLGVATSDLANLDTSLSDGELFASLTVAPGTTSNFYVINAARHTVTPIGLPIGGGTPLRAMAVASPGFVRLTPPATYSVTEGSLVPVPVQIDRYGGTDGPLTVEVRTWPGTATALIDYTGARTTYTFLPGGALVASPVAAILNDNTLAQPDRTINVGAIVSSLYQPATVDQLSTGLITIHDDDTLKNPTIQITSPTTDPTYTAGSLFVAVSGTASDPDGTIQSVQWSSSNNTGGTASGTNDWIINAVALVKGVNTISVTARDNDGRGATDTIVITVNELTYYLAEGATSSFFTTDILLANPNDQAAPFTLQFLNEQGPLPPQSLTLAPQSRKTIRVNDLPGMAQAGGLSTIITSTDAVPIVVERTMMWDQRGYGSATDHASDGVAPKWYFAEGAQGFFRTYLLLANPREGNNVAHVRYLRDGEPAFTHDYPLSRYQRFTVDIGSHPELRFRTFGIEVTFDQPGVAERAMYFGSDPLWLGGHESGGATSLSRSWFLAEGATGSYFKTYVLLANPTSQAANVSLDFLPSSGAVVHTTRVVPANERRSVDISGEDPSLRNAAVATRVTSDVPIVVERAQYWPGGPDTWQEAHNSFGLTEAGLKWGLAEGRIGMSAHFQPYILVANPGSVVANVTIRFLREEGSPSGPFSRTFTVQPNSRFTVFGDAGIDTSPLRDENFGAVLTSDWPIVVERALYSDALGVHWQAGSNATATRLPTTVP
jgi:hypothetical protein